MQLIDTCGIKIITDHVPLLSKFIYCERTHLIRPNLVKLGYIQLNHLKYNVYT